MNIVIFFFIFGNILQQTASELPSNDNVENPTIKLSKLIPILEDSFEKASNDERQQTSNFLNFLRKEVKLKDQFTEVVWHSAKFLLDMGKWGTMERTRNVSQINGFWDLISRICNWMKSWLSIFTNKRTTSEETESNYIPIRGNDEMGPYRQHQEYSDDEMHHQEYSVEQKHRRKHLDDENHQRENSDLDRHYQKYSDDQDHRKKYLADTKYHRDNLNNERYHIHEPEFRIHAPSDSHLSRYTEENANHGPSIMVPPDLDKMGSLQLTPADLSAPDPRRNT